VEFVGGPGKGCAPFAAALTLAMHGAPFGPGLLGFNTNLSQFAGFRPTWLRPVAGTFSGSAPLAVGAPGQLRAFFASRARWPATSHPRGSGVSPGAAGPGLIRIGPEAHECPVKPAGLNHKSCQMLKDRRRVCGASSRPSHGLASGPSRPKRLGPGTAPAERATRRPPLCTISLSQPRSDRRHDRLDWGLVGPAKVS
jgi:hypothetical protein